ncbi:SDR family NAD(P)-dependent oxidoreductase [Sporosarcina sp. BI001-red]|uniref:elongation factor P 5-aminopentanone reductase n=1 Tax=Sporosarcina sp. BI001-red TaxID=2282866 RepID=UPI000E23483C|nr:SDR family oxidoreductase [Sporosarcina sp. BI001-red]REB09816.1 SDR family NAD(P)-dependent oxidoreductase [Sporosarcina sp. BI001-red]
MSTERRALVLGASGGIGEAICKKLASEGWSLYMHYNSGQQAVKKIQMELSENYSSAEFKCVQMDFGQLGAAERLAAKLTSIQAIVVANGQSMLKLLTETTEEEMESLWRVHVQNPVRLISLLSAGLRSYASSYVVFIGSIWGNTGAAGEVMYSSVKGAQHAFVKAYAKEAAYGGIRVNAIAPGWIETRMNEEIPKDERQMVMEEIPLMIPGRPAEVADLVDFLTSGKADYMTGEILKLNGGWYI